jgi:anti-sigma regulatory factor (Ser/Thr protein kinase)
MPETDLSAEGLHKLRETVLAHATAAGMPGSRAIDVMLVAHELATNAIRHGGGTGRLRIRIAAGALHCQVTDPGIARPDGHRPNAVPGPTITSPAAEPWPYQRGHGLWLVRQAADRFTVITGPHGSQVDVSFNLHRTS